MAGIGTGARAGAGSGAGAAALPAGASPATATSATPGWAVKDGAGSPELGIIWAAERLCPGEELCEKEGDEGDMDAGGDETEDGDEKSEKDGGEEGDSTEEGEGEEKEGEGSEGEGEEGDWEEGEEKSEKYGGEEGDGIREGEGEAGEGEGEEGELEGDEDNDKDEVGEAGKLAPAEDLAGLLRTAPLETKGEEVGLVGVTTELVEPVPLIWPVSAVGLEIFGVSLIPRMSSEPLLGAEAEDSVEAEGLRAVATEPMPGALTVSGDSTPIAAGDSSSGDASGLDAAASLVGTFTSVLRFNGGTVPFTLPCAAREDTYDEKEGV